MRFEVRADEVAVYYRGFSLRARKRMREVALLAVDITRQGQATEESKGSFGFAAGSGLDTQIADLPEESEPWRDVEVTNRQRIRLR